MIRREKDPQKIHATGGSVEISNNYANNDDVNFMEVLKETHSIFGSRIYITFSEAANLIGVSTKTLRLHVALGNIKFSRVGHGKRKIRRVFTARNIAMFRLHAATV